MRKLSIFVAAFVLTLGLAQCKKEQPATPQDTDSNLVHITVNVNNNGSRADVNTINGKITFNDGDKLYVGYDNACAGTLDYNTSTSKFSGEINLTQSGEQPLHFYYLGGGTATQESGTQRYTVDINDQSENYPVISYGTSNVDYTGAGNYTTTLLNKCALVKFTLASGTTNAVAVDGMMTKATIDFANPGNVTPSTAGEITLHAGASNTEKWAILLPQDAVANAPVTIGSSAGYLVNVPLIEENDFAPEISTINNTTTITWDNTNVFNSTYEDVCVDSWRRSETFEGIKITMNGDGVSSFYPYTDNPEEGPTATLNVYGNDGDSFTFTAPDGKKFTKIEIVDNGYFPFYSFTEYGDWTIASDNKIEWNGTAAKEVTLGDTETYCSNLNRIVFTLVDE